MGNAFRGFSDSRAAVRSEREQAKAHGKIHCGSTMDWDFLTPDEPMRFYALIYTDSERQEKIELFPTREAAEEAAAKLNVKFALQEIIL